MDWDAGEDLETMATKHTDIIISPQSTDPWDYSSFIHEMIFNLSGILQHYQSIPLFLICPTDHL